MIARQDGASVKGFELNDKRLRRIRSVGYGLKCCTGVRSTETFRKKSQRCGLFERS
jgi:hypothetical protein